MLRWIVTSRLQWFGTVIWVLKEAVGASYFPFHSLLFNYADTWLGLNHMDVRLSASAKASTDSLDASWQSYRGRSKVGSLSMTDYLWEPWGVLHFIYTSLPSGNLALSVFTSIWHNKDSLNTSQNCLHLQNAQILFISKLRGFFC